METCVRYRPPPITKHQPALCYGIYPTTPMLDLHSHQDTLTEPASFSEKHLCWHASTFYNSIFNTAATKLDFLDPTNLDAVQRAFEAIPKTLWY